MHSVQPRCPPEGGHPEPWWEPQPALRYLSPRCPDMVVSVQFPHDFVDDLGFGDYYPDKECPFQYPSDDAEGISVHSRITTEMVSGPSLDDAIVDVTIVLPSENLKLYSEEMIQMVKASIHL